MKCLEKLILIIVVIGDLQNKEMIGNTWSPTSSMRNLKYFLAYYSNNKSRVHQLDCIGTFQQSNANHGFFLKLDIRYGEYLQEYAKYFGKPLILKKSMYGMNKSGNLFSDELTNWIIDEA